MLAELERDEYDSGDEALREAREQVTLLTGLEATLDHLVNTSGGLRGDMGLLRTGLAHMRAEMVTEAKRLAPAGGGVVDTNAVERARLEQDFDAAKQAYDLAVEKRNEALANGITGDPYAPFKKAVETTKAIKRQAEKDLAAFNKSHPP
jgi:hypothetical protein